MPKLDIHFMASELDCLPLLDALRIAPALVIDLGCGDGRVLEWFSQRYACKVVGYDLDPARIAESRARLGESAELHCSDLWQADVSQADVVYTFLDEGLMPRVQAEIMPRMRQGSYLISNHYPLAGKPYPNHYRQTPDLGTLLAYPISGASPT